MKLAYEKNELLSERQFKNHIQLYEGYINKVNKITDGMENIISTSKDLQYALNGAILHELYFENISNKNNIGANNLFKDENSFKIWKDDFIKTALNSRGWTIYGYENRTSNFINFSLPSHDEGIICGMIPIIVLDMYEHAYYIDYDNDKLKYIENFLKNIDLNIIEERLSKI